MNRKSLLFSAETLAEKRQVVVNVSSEDVDRAGDIVVQAGIDYRSFLKAGATILWNHNSDFPIAKAVEMGLVDGRLRAKAQFPQPGVSAKADEVYGLIKSGVINAASIGFQPKEYVPIIGGDGYRYSKIELMEFSFVSVPAAPGATIVARRAEANTTKWVWRADRRSQLLARRKEVEARAARINRELGSLLADIERRRINKLVDDMEREAGLDFPDVPARFKRRFDSKRQIRALIRPPGIDVNGNDLLPGGCNISRYKGPVFWEHERKLPVAWCTEVEVRSSGVWATAVFPKAGIDDIADLVWRKVQRGEANRCSVGFIRNKGEAAPTRKWFLREWSLTTEGAHPEAKVISVAGAETPATAAYSRWESDAHYCADWRAQEYKRIAAASAAMRYH